MTRAQYEERARTICMLVNARRMRLLGKEPLREQHIMRVIRLAFGPAPEPVYPTYHPRRPRRRPHWRIGDG
jgi:hypothetical protein